MKKIKITALALAILMFATMQCAGAIANATLIIDAGHGGADGGASSVTGALESEINLDIALRLEQLMAFCGVRTILTRESETINYSEKATTIRAKKVEDTKNRVSLVNAMPDAVLISIHQNTYPGAGPYGSQVLYAGTPGSKELAEHMQRVLIAALTPDSRRAASKIPGNVYLMNNIGCPAILIECGFLSNPTEDALLQTQQYRLKVAMVITAGYLQGCQ